MRRIVSIWLPHWEIERLTRQNPGQMPSDRPLVLVDKDAHGIRIRALNETAVREGLRSGMALSDARAAVPGLLSRPSEPAADLLALRQLARWCGRYSPYRNTAVIRYETGSVDFGLWLDITGAAHLYGGEEQLLADLNGRLTRMGFTPRLGLADTYGAAHALARYAVHGGAVAVAQPGDIRGCLENCTVEGLRLAPNVAVLLRRLGLYSIGQLNCIPRTSLARRFRDEKCVKVKSDAMRLAAAVLLRLDQALGIQREPLRPLSEPPLLAVRKSFPDMLITSAPVREEACTLMEELCRGLEAMGLGARRLRLVLIRADGTTAQVLVGTSASSRDPSHLFALMSDKIDALDAGFGVDGLLLEALRVERSASVQTALAAGGALSSMQPDQLVDRLRNRSSSINVFGLEQRQSHIPERAFERVPPLRHKQLPPPSQGVQSPSWPQGSRPPLLLTRPEEIAVLAQVPEGPPARFTWRRVAHRVARAEGPERLASEWWRHIGCSDDMAAGRHVRDYYRIEVESGARYWVFRDGLYADEERKEPPRWFLHGLFG